MKNFLILILTFVGISVSASVDKPISLTIGQWQTETLALSQTKIKGKTVSLLLYSSPLGKEFVKILPRDGYREQKAQFEKWASYWTQVRYLASISCQQPLRIGRQAKLEVTCLDEATSVSQTEFVQWFERVSKLARP